MTEAVTDPEILKHLETGQDNQPIDDPALLAQLEGGERSLPDRFVRGITAPVRAAGEMIEPMLPKGPAGSTAEATPAGVKTATKLKPHEIENDPVEFAGSLLNPTPFGAAAGLAKLAPKMPKMAKTMAVGGITGLLEPTGKPITDPEFGPTKFQQGASGMLLGFGFHMGGKGLSAGMEKVADFMARKHPDHIMNGAVQKVLERISKNEKHTGLTATDAIDLIETTNAQGKPMRVADLGSLEEPNEAIRSLSGSVGRKTSEGKQIAKTELQGRDKTAPDRLTDDVEQYIFSGPTAHQATEIMLSARSAAAQPLYSEADKLQNIWSPRLQQFIDDIDFKEAMKAGYASERRRALAEGRPFNPTMMGVDLDELGQIKILRTPNLHVLDMGKRGLDALISAERNELTGRLSSKGRDLDLIRRAYLEEIDSLDKRGVYRKAREAWAGPSASMDAIRLGRAAFSMGQEENQAAFNKLTAGDQEFYRLGLADIVKERIGKTGFAGDEAKQIIKSPWMQKQLRPSFRNEDDFNKFVDAVTKENVMFKTKQDVFGGSPTAERVEGDATAQLDMIKGRGWEAAHQIIINKNPLRFVGQMYRLHRDLGLRPDPKMNEALAKVLFTPEGTSLLKTQRLRNPNSSFQRRTDAITPYIGGVATGQLTEEKPESREEGGPVNAGQPYVVGENGPEVIVPQQSGEVVPNNESVFDEAAQAQGAREAAAARMKQSVQPEGGRQEGGLTEAALGMTLPGSLINAYKDYQEGNYEQAGSDLIGAAPMAGGLLAKGVKAAVKAAPKAIAAAGGLAGASLFSSTGAESAKLTRAQQQQLQLDQERIKAEAQASTEKERARAQSEQEKVRVEAQTRQEELRLKTELEERRIKEADDRRAAEEKKWQEASLREKYPAAATWLSTSGIALSALLPYGIRMRQAFKEGQFFKDWSRAATDLEKAVKSGDQAQAKLLVNQLSEFKKQAGKAQEKASQVTNWMVGAMTPLELSMLPEQADLIFGSEQSKVKAEEAIFDWRRYPAALLQGGALSALGVKTPLPPTFSPHPQAATARGEGAVKAFKKDQRKTNKGGSLTEVMKDIDEYEVTKKRAAKK